MGFTAKNAFRDQLYRVMPGRRLVATKDGWVALCHEACKIGDEVWLLEGGTSPFVLRPQEDDSIAESVQAPMYRFYGECYVHGVMEGKLVKGKEEEIRQKLTEVVLV